MRLENRVAIVTAVGKQNGMGRGIARVLAGEGADLVLNSASPKSVEDAVAEIRSLGRRAVGVPGDAAERGICDQLAAAAIQQLGRLDILICNAGINTFTAFAETTEEAARRCVEVNFFGTFNLCQAALPAMKERGGSIVMITSVHAESAYPRSSIYNFTKAGLNHFAATLGVELARYRIRVNAVEPGWVQTPGSTGDLDAQELARVERDLIPWGRVGQAEDIGRACAFLASDDADYVTSAMLRVDGGLIAAERKK